MLKCLECNNVLEQFKTGDKPFCNNECENKFTSAELKIELGISNNATCLNCNEPLGFEPQMCCTDGSWSNPNSPCGCMGYPIDPPFCSDECEFEFSQKCHNCEGEGWVLINDNGLPNKDTCPNCNGSGKRTRE